MRFILLNYNENGRYDFFSTHDPTVFPQLLATQFLSFAQNVYLSFSFLWLRRSLCLISNNVVGELVNANFCWPSRWWLSQQLNKKRTPPRTLYIKCLECFITQSMAFLMQASIAAIKNSLNKYQLYLEISS